MPLAEYLTEQFYVNRFVQRAHERNPPAWDIGEDTVLGMWVYEAPFPITALHWGWDKIHDLCFKCKEKRAAERDPRVRFILTFWFWSAHWFGQ